MAVDIRPLYGPLLFGVFLNMILYGVLIMQTYVYYLSYKKDRLWMKLFVLYLFIAESVNIACHMYIAYNLFVENFNRPEVLQYIPTLMFSDPATIVAVSVPIQLFFGWRVLLLTKSKIIPALIVALALVSLAAGIWMTYTLERIKLISRAAELEKPAILWVLSSCAVDVLITVALVVTLIKKKTGFMATDDVLSRIIRMTVQTGFLTTVFALGNLICCLTISNTGANFVFDFPIAKLYSNCLLSTLNARASLLQSSISTADKSGRQLHQHQQQQQTTPSRRNDTGFEMEPVKRSVYGTMHNVEFSGGRDFYGPGDGIKVTTKVMETREDDIPGLGHTQ